jgi:hypothetical protein
MLLTPILETIYQYRCKRGFGWWRPWNREELKIFHGNIYENGSGLSYAEQIKDSVIETMLLFTGYSDDGFIENTVISEDTIFRTLFHERVDEKGRKFEGITLSFSLQVESDMFDRVDLIFEDILVDGEFDGEVNQVRLYLSPVSRYVENDYDLFYWDASDRKSLDVFQTAYRDSIYFYEKDTKERAWSEWQHRYLSNFQKRTEVVQSSSFSLC